MNRSYSKIATLSGCRRAGLWLPVTLLVLLVCSVPARGASVPAGPWQVTADRLEQDRDNDRYLAAGNVTIARGGIRLNADRVSLDRRTMYAEAEGHVMVTSGQDVITGRRLEIDLDAETGTIYQGTVFLAENHFYIHGERLHKLGPATYRGDHVRLTTCDGADPAWQIQGRNLEITVDGYGKMDHASLWARNMPLAYIPAMIFPAKTKRQTGLLVPEAGFSDRLGVIYGQPFFWAINEQQDATFYLNSMSRRGLMLGMEYRYALGQGSRGTLMYDFLDDRKVDDGTKASEAWAYDETPVRGNGDRYWLRGRIDQQLPGGFTAKLDLDLVSDPDYLHEFKSTVNGFDASDRLFTRDFGREIDAYEDLVRTNRLNLNRSWSQYSLNLDSQWRDDVVGRQADGVNDVLQQLQSITLDGVRQPLASTGFYFDLESEYRYFYLENRRRGQRLDIHPRILRPMRIGRHLALEPSLGLRQTSWYVENDSFDNQIEDHQPLSREMVDVMLDASTDLYRIYRPGKWGVEALKHEIRPRLVYEYIPRRAQEKYPFFDDLDRIDEVNRITALLSQTFTTRSRPPVREAHNDVGPSSASSPVYREIGYIELSQGYDLLEAREGNLAERSDANRRRVFSPWILEMEFSPLNALSLRADVQRSPYSGHFDARNIAVEVTDSRGDEVFVEHRYTYGLSESIFTQLLVPLSDNLTTYTEWEQNLHDRHSLESGVGLLYTAQCWALDLGYLYEYGAGKQFAFKVHLYGLAGLGRPSVVSRRITDPFSRRVQDSIYRRIAAEN